MLGNVWEWCQDKYVAGSGRMASGNASVRVIRGGAANSTASQLRSSFRAGLPIDTRSPRLGMRLVLEP
jgi:formylglycine-generating enzyme required for sulfatase activity